MKEREKLKKKKKQQYIKLYQLCHIISEKNYKYIYVNMAR